MIFKDVVFLIADGQPDSYGEHFDMDSKIEVLEELMIWSNPDIKTFVGWARNIRRVDSLFLADIHTHEEKGAIPVEVSKHLVPCVQGSIKFRAGKSLKDIKITALELTPCNADKRIKTLNNYSFSVEGFVKK